VASSTNGLGHHAFHPNETEKERRYRLALERLRTYPLLTRRHGPLEAGAKRIVEEALRGQR
jgi:hypothetical protein